MKKIIYSLLLISLLTGFLTFARMNHHVNDTTTAVPDSIADGGRLYDKWWTELKLDKPTTTHPLYPAIGKKRGADSWRCKECHGWDYLGKEGAYGSGSHFTGITGISRFNGGSVESVLKIITDEKHQFHTVLSETSLGLLASFVVKGQVDMNAIIESNTKRVSGDRRNGSRIYNDNCGKCHGDSGRNMNFSHDEEKPEYIGTVAVHNPWEALHKLRNGHPGAIMDQEHIRMSGHMMMHNIQLDEPMPSMRKKLTIQEQADLLHYLQTLPVK